MEKAVMRIDGAVVMPDMKKIDVNGEPGFIIPEMNDSYYLACCFDNILMASKNGTDFVVALAVECMGKRFNAPEAVKMLQEAECRFWEYGIFLLKRGEKNGQ